MNPHGREHLGKVHCRYAFLLYVMLWFTFAHLDKTWLSLRTLVALIADEVADEVLPHLAVRRALKHRLPLHQTVYDRAARSRGVVGVEVTTVVLVPVRGE